MKIPFGWLPGHWGLKGKSKDLAQADYELTGEAYARRIAEINIDDETALDIELLRIDRKYKKISKEDYDYKFVDLKFEDEHNRILAKLELDKKYGKLTNAEYEKAIFSLDDKPWVGVVGSEYEPQAGTSGFSFELDWNDAFVKMCVAAGYNGATDEQIIEQWFEDVATEEFYKDMMLQSEQDGDSSFVSSSAVSSTTHEHLEDGKTKHS